VQRESDAARALKEAGFALPEVDGGSGPTLTTTETTRARHQAGDPVRALAQRSRAKRAGPAARAHRHRARQRRGVTVCTRVPPDLLVEDPIANEAIRR
jgi:pyruvate/2-oxoglutarate dehydrogenase complex dihydrolipoamide acyltransferase (E2) component